MEPTPNMTQAENEEPHNLQPQGSRAHEGPKQPPPLSGKENLADNPQNSVPSIAARLLAFGSIVVAGACGGLIGFAVIYLGCNGECRTLAGIVGLVSALGTALGIAAVAVLMLRSSIEWRERNRSLKTPTT